MPSPERGQQFHSLINPLAWEIIKVGLPALAVLGSGIIAEAKSQQPTHSPNKPLIYSDNQSNVLPSVQAFNQKAWNDRVRSSEISQEVIQIAGAPFTFTNNLGNVEWAIDNARFGIPPNNGLLGVGTIDVTVNKQYQYPFQVDTSKYPELVSGDSSSIAIAAVIGNPELDFYHLANGIATRSGYLQARVEAGRGINTPKDYSTRRVYTPDDGLPSSISYGDLYKYIAYGQDAQGIYLDLYLQNLEDVSQNGLYRGRLDNQGRLVGKFSKVVSYRVVLPVVSKNHQ